MRALSRNFARHGKIAAKGRFRIVTYGIGFKFTKQVAVGHARAGYAVRDKVAAMDVSKHSEGLEQSAAIALNFNIDAYPRQSKNELPYRLVSRSGDTAQFHRLNLLRLQKFDQFRWRARYSKSATYLSVANFHLD